MVRLVLGLLRSGSKNWRESFKPITNCRNRNRVITFDSHLKTALTATETNWFIHWIAIHPTGSDIHPLNNWDLVYLVLRRAIELWNRERMGPGKRGCILLTLSAPLAASSLSQEFLHHILHKLYLLYPQQHKVWDPHLNTHIEQKLKLFFNHELSVFFSTQNLRHPQSAAPVFHSSNQRQTSSPDRLQWPYFSFSLFSLHTAFTRDANKEKNAKWTKDLQVSILQRCPWGTESGPSPCERLTKAMFWVCLILMTSHNFRSAPLNTSGI